MADVSPRRPSAIACVPRSHAVLTWVSSKNAQRSQLSTFRCAIPEESERNEDTGEELHYAPWELDVQKHFRAHRGIVFPPQFLTLGLEDGALVAAMEVHVFPLDQSCFISAIGVRHDRRGRGHGFETLDRVHNVMEKYDMREFLATARIAPENYAAKQLFSRQGYEMSHFEEGYETWGATFATRTR